MATFVYNDIIKFILPSVFLFSRDEDDNGKEIVHIMTGEYENDEGETCYEIDCNVNCFEFDPEKEDEEITSENLLNVLTDRLNISGRMKFPGKPTTVLVNKKIPISVYGNLIKMFALIGIVQISDWLVLQITTSGRFDDDDPSKNTAKVEFLYEVLKAVRINGKKLPIGSTAPHEIENTLHLTFDEDEEIINASPKVQLSISVDDETTTYEYTSEGMMEVGKEYLTSVMPDESLYPHYNSLRYADGPDLNGTSVVVNAGGTEYSFVSFRNAAEDSDTEEPMKALFNRIVAKDTERYDLDRKAKKMQKLFHVNESAFDPRHDRECELEEGFLHRAYMLSGLRSFAWTLADYCKQYGCTPDDIDPDVIFRIANFVANRSWLNYDDTTYCQGLCSGSDLHVYYIPDGVSQADRKKLLPSKEDIDRVKRMKQLFPMYNEILPEVHSLNALRKDLAYIYPAIKVMWDHLEEDRDYNEALLGNVADIVYAWCALALAAKEPFYSEDGPMSCYFSQPVDKEKQEAKWEADKFEKAEDAAEEWMREYEKCLETDPVIDFNGTIFVFSGLVGPWAEKEHPTVRKVIEKGGQYRTKVSGVTNYLVVNPGYAGRSKVDAALEQLQKGKNVKVILLEDLEKALEGKTTTKKAASATAKTAKAATAKTSVKSAPTTKSKDKSSSASSAAKTAVTVVSKSDCVIDEFGTLTACNGTAKEIVLPDGIKTISVGAFSAYKNITSVVIPEGVEVIEGFAFSNCRSLKNVTLPDSIQKIGENTFSFCEQLESITIPDGCTEIEDSAFSYCRSLKSVTLPSTIQKISKIAFSFCEQLESITIPDGCTEIEDSAFSYCSSLKSVTLPSTIQKIGEDTFTSCKQLRSISIPDGCTEIGDGAFFECSSLKNVTLPSTVQKISAHAFTSCEQLESITIPNGCKEIEDSAFSNCGSLKRVTLPSTIQKIGEDAFNYCERLTSITIPDGCKVIEDNTFYNCSSLKRVTLPGTIQKIGEYAFAACEQLKSITIPDECKEIGVHCFTGCKNLKDIYVTGSVIVFGDNAFSTLCDDMVIHTTRGSEAERVAKESNWRVDYKSAPTTKSTAKSSPACSAAKADDTKGSESDCVIDEFGTLTAYNGTAKEIVLPDGIKTISRGVFGEKNTITSVVIPEGVEVIGDLAFLSCSSLKSVTLPATIQKIGEFAFQSCEQLTSIIVPDGCKEIGAHAFSSCSSLKSVTFPSTIQKIGENAFSSCEQLESITIPDGCTEIGDGAFFGCSSLKSVTLPSAIQKIGKEAFRFCGQLTSITVPDGCKEIGASAFSNCSSLKSVTLPSADQKIDEYVFQFCGQLTSITIPDGYKEIGSSAFSNCSSLKSVTLPGTIQKIGENAFLFCSQLTSITIPDGCREIGDSAFDECTGLKNVTLPGTIQKIGANAFYACEELTSITVPDGCKEIGANCFDSCFELKDIYITGSVIDIGLDAFSTSCYAMVIHTTKGSEAERIAKQNNWKVDYISAPMTGSMAKSSSASSVNKAVGTEGSENDHVIDDFGTLTSYNGSISATHQASYQPAKKEGCYIATAVYGSYDAPQVMTLRRYRDEILRATAFGRWFIRAYYRLSPPVAEKLKNAKHINKFVRSILDKWVEKLNRRFCA